MAEVAERPAGKASRRTVDKFAARRDELATAALQTLAELGYARTSLREIAQNSDFSHGVLHYYFTDKVDLIAHCVRRYKASCVTRYDEIVTSATTAPELAAAFGAAMVSTLREDAAMHRLWYDLRNQSLFEEWFRGDVREIDAGLERMIWRIVSSYAELVGRPPAVPSSVAYAMFDGLFQQALFAHLTGADEPAAALAGNVELVLASCAGDPRAGRG